MNHKYKESFTLIELIVAMVLIAIVSVASMAFCELYFRMALVIPSQTIDKNYAQQKMENIYMNGSWNSGSDIPVTGINRAWSTAHGANPGNNDYRVVTVNVQSQR